MFVLQGFEKHYVNSIMFFIESDSSIEVKNWMLHRGYQGPFYYHKKRNLLSVKLQKRKEDGIFISENLIPRLADRIRIQLEVGN